MSLKLASIPRVNEQLVAYLEDLLAKAKTGKLHSCFFVGLSSARDRYISGYAVAKDANTIFMLGGIEAEKNLFMNEHCYGEERTYFDE